MAHAILGTQQLFDDELTSREIIDNEELATRRNFDGPDAGANDEGHETRQNFDGPDARELDEFAAEDDDDDDEFEVYDDEFDDYGDYEDYGAWR